MDPIAVYFIVGGIFVLVIGIDVYNWSKYGTITIPELRLKRVTASVDSSVTIIGLTLFSTAVLFRVNLLQYAQPIPHSQFNTITLKDFKAFRLPNQTLHGTENFAFITTTINVDTEGEGIRIEALFHPSRSYTYSNSDDKFLLQHELYHFHITEYYARRLRREVSEAKPLPQKSEISQIATMLWREERREQALYDRETYHGYIMSMQKKWQLRIDSLLNSQQSFTNEYVFYKP